MKPDDLCMLSFEAVDWNLSFSLKHSLNVFLCSFQGAYSAAPSPSGRVAATRTGVLRNRQPLVGCFASSLVCGLSPAIEFPLSRTLKTIQKYESVSILIGLTASFAFAPFACHIHLVCTKRST